MSENIIQQKTYTLALDVIKVYKDLIDRKKEFVISRQLLRCGTSVGANVEEAIGGQSDKDFFMKITIAYKEARETRYWLRLLKDSGFLDSITAQALDDKCTEVCRILSKIQITMKAKHKIYA